MRAHRDVSLVEVPESFIDDYDLQLNPAVLRRRLCIFRTPLPARA